MLEKNGKTRFISGYKFDLNSHGIGLIVDDKYALYEVLKEKKIPVAEHKIVYNKTNKLDYAIGCNTYEYVKDYFVKNDNNIVIKPNDGTCGNNVFNVTDINEIDDILDKIFVNNYSISICPFYDIKHEYRVIMLEGECELLYAKYLPIVTGDGKKTIRQLLIEFNYDYFIDKLEDSKYNKVLADKEKFKYNWKFNLSQGAIAKRLEDKILSDKLIKIAKQVCDEINLKFGSIDIIQTTDDKLLVLEANSGVMLENYIILNPDEYLTAKNIYKKAIENLFKKL
jgi:glutathione synthase/RimK-type ligase-like ATP-grasp enzyme